MRKLILFFTGFLFIVPLTTNADQRFVKLVKEIQPAVVTIITYDKNKKPIGQGSGFFLDKKGHIVTNYHVLKGAYSAIVKAFDGKEYAVKLVLSETEEADLVKVLVDIPQDAVKFAQITRVLPQVGEDVLVIGSPMGLDQTVSAGIISAIRDIPTVGKIFQISAPISPGSSGSPVVNMKGQVIGVASFQMIEGQNLNFAVSGEQVLNLKRARKSKPLPEWSVSVTEKERNQCLAAYQKGRQLIWAGEYEKAVSYFKKVAPDHPDCAGIQINLGSAYCELKRYEDAIQACREAIRITPVRADAYALLGYAYGKLGRYNEEIEAYKQAIRIKPDYADVHTNLGICYINLGRYNEAIEACKQAIRINPDDAKAHDSLGICYGRLGRYNEAIEAHKQAIRINSDDAKAHNNLGVCYGRLGRYNEEIEAYKQAIRIKPDYADVHTNLGICYINLGRYNEAIEACKQAIRINPDDAKAHHTLGGVYFFVGDNDLALDEYKILKNLDTELAKVLFDLIYE